MTIPTEAAYREMTVAAEAMLRAYIMQVKAGQFLSGSSGTTWLSAVAAEATVGREYIEARDAWEATVRGFIAAATE
jgi:hypothetical protein